MSKKILTEELIQETLAKKGWTEDLSYEAMLKKVCEYYDTEIIEDWNDNCDFFIYAESTADGYEVFIATSNPRNPCINEDVYYYDSDLAGVLEDALAEGGSIYVDDLDSDYFQSAVEESYVYLYDRLLEEIENELIDEGYEYDEEE